MLVTFLISPIIGWLSTLLIAVTITLPYILKRRRVNSTPQRHKPYLIRLRPHYWLGYILLMLSVVHAIFSLTSANMSDSQSLGVLFAIGALLFLFRQLVLGINLNSSTQHRRTLRRQHFRTMLVIIMLGLIHIFLNTTLISILFP